MLGPKLRSALSTRTANSGGTWGLVGATGVDFSADGEILVVAYDDGTIRWLRWSDGEELLALFVEPQSRKWVAWTPTGYYMASAGGEDLIGWHSTAAGIRRPISSPPRNSATTSTGPTSCGSCCRRATRREAVRHANAALRTRDEAKPIGAALPPVVAIASPADGAHFSGNSVEIAYSLRSPSGLPIDRLDVLADGQPVARGWI